MTTKLAMYPIHRSGTILQYQNGDAEDAAGRKREHVHAVHGFNRFWVGGSGSGSHGKNYSGNPSSSADRASEAQHTPTIASQDEDVDLEYKSYLNYVHRRYERLHYDEDVRLNSKSNEQHQHAFFTSNDTHGNAMYALNWANQVVSDHLWSPSESASASTYSSTTASSSTGVLTKVSTSQAQQGVTNVIQRLRSMRMRYLAAQKRVLLAIADAIVRRMRQVVLCVAQLSMKRVKAFVFLSTIFLVLCVKPLLMEAYTSVNPTQA
jgi:hypothetical protein